MTFPGQIPYYPKGKEPLPPDVDREEYEQQLKYQKFAEQGMESCLVKTVLAGGAGFGIGAFFSLMSASFAYEDPVLRANREMALQGAGKVQVGAQRARDVLKDMGKGMWTSGKGFGKVGALFAGIECVIEGYRAKNDIYNSVSAGFVSGGVLARNAGPKAMIGGGFAFAAFSAAVDLLFLRRETPDDD